MPAPLLGIEEDFIRIVTIIRFMGMQLEMTGISRTEAVHLNFLIADLVAVIQSSMVSVSPIDKDETLRRLG